MKYSENFLVELAQEPDVHSFWNAVRLIDSDKNQAIENLKNLSENGSILSMVYLGDLYVNGRGVPRDVRRGDEWYKEAAKYGSIEASYRLAVARWKSGAYESSIKDFISLTKRGFSPAMCCLGSIYVTGMGVPRDERRALTFFKMASRRDHLLAKQGISKIYRERKKNLCHKLIGYYIILYLLFVGSWYKFFYPESDRFRCW